MGRVRFGVIGCGKIHSTHCDALQAIDAAQLTAVYDTDRGAACAASDRYGVPAPDTLDAFLGLVDAVAVCVPSGLHAEVGIPCAEAGKHVLVEKPIDVSVAAAQSLVAACRSSNVLLGSVSQHRFAKPIQRLKAAVESGELGSPIEGSAYVKWHRTQAYYDSGDWRGTYRLDGGGCLMNQGIHTVDMIQWIMGGIRAVQALTRTFAHEIEVEDTAMALVEYANGAVGVIQGSTCSYPGFAERLEVHGRYGSVVIEGDKTKLWEVDPELADEGLYGGGVMMQPTPNRHGWGAASGDADDLSTTWGEQHRLQLEDFALAILEHRDPFITGEMGIEPLRVILAIYESAREGGRWISVNP
jgi:predicted dehydrogenase